MSSGGEARVGRTAAGYPMPGRAAARHLRPGPIRFLEQQHEAGHRPAAGQPAGAQAGDHRGEIGAADVHVPRDDDQLVERLRHGVSRNEMIGTQGHDRRPVVAHQVSSVAALAAASG